jgi:hypothetical protein
MASKPNPPRPRAAPKKAAGKKTAAKPVHESRPVGVPKK